MELHPSLFQRFALREKSSLPGSVFLEELFCGGRSVTNTFTLATMSRHQVHISVGKPTASPAGSKKAARHQEFLAVKAAAGPKKFFGTTKGAFGKEDRGKGGKRKTGGKPLAKGVSCQLRLLFLRQSPTHCDAVLTRSTFTRPPSLLQDCGQEKTRRGGEAVFDDTIRK